MKILTIIPCAVVCSILPLTAGTICPAVTPNPGITAPSGCNAVITFTNTGPAIGGIDSHPYDGFDDQLIGVTNNSPDETLLSLSLTGSGVFAFDFDGICSHGYINASNCTSEDSTGYGPNGVTFTNISSYPHNSGVVNFAGGLAPGKSIFFSLEAAPAVGGFTINRFAATPEPATLGLIGLSLIGAALCGRKRFSRK